MPTEASQAIPDAAAQAAAQAIEADARRMGWKPQAEFRGPAAEWVDAKTFVENGRRILPIVNANLERERQANEALRAELAQQKAQTAELSQTVESLKTFQTDMAKQQRERIRAEEIAKLKAARESGDVAAEVAAMDRIAETRGEPVAARAAPVETAVARQPPAPTAVSDTARAWGAENPWFGSDPVKTDVALGINARFAAAGRFAGLSERQCLDLVRDETMRQFAAPLPAAAAAAARVEGGGPSGSAAGGGSGAAETGYNALPAEARAECDSQGERLGLIGPNKAFKTKDEWRAYYASNY